MRKLTKASIILVVFCLLVAAPRLAYGVQALQTPANAGAPAPSAWHASFLPQAGYAPYVVGNLTSHHGPVMHSVTNYLIFWLPSGYHFDTSAIDQGYPSASDANYEALLSQYLQDLSSTAFYSIVQQYTDSTGAPGMSTTLGGTWVDTSSYPNSEGTKSNPLQDSDIESEVVKAMNANGWTSGNGNNAFFVLTGHNVYGCAGSNCSYNTYCAYHSTFQSSSGQVVIYSDIPNPGNAGNLGSCLATAASKSSAPNTAFADSAISLVAHEGFEAVTDPVFNGWYYLDTDHEIGDECAWKFGSLSSDGSNLVLNSHRYLIQEMWSNKAGGCYIPPSVPTLQVIANYQVQGGGAGFAPPTFAYYSGGVLTKTPLSTVPQTLNVDLGTTWNVTGTLAGSTSAERWQTVQATSGVLKVGATFVFNYYHQFFASFGFGVLGGGSGYSAPTLTITQFGSQQPVTVAVGVGSDDWVDAQSRYNYTNQLPTSSSSERWVAQAASGTVAAPGPVSPQYYHQYLVPVSYSGGGPASSPPVFTYYSLGNTLTASLGQGPKSLWVDAGTGYSATNPLGASTPTDRWFAARASGTVSSWTALQLAYYHQYIVSVQGGAAASQWFNSSAQASITTPGVYARGSGSGLRVTGYRVDGGPVQAVSPTAGPVTVSLQISGPHGLDFSTVSQYQVGLDSGALASIASISPPTISGDAYWYDSGSTVTLVLNSIWGRDSSQGSRLVSYATDGGASVTLASKAPVTALNAIQVSSPHSVTGVVSVQYRLTTTGGSIESSTAPSIQGDPGWYDSGTKATVSYNYVWNQTLDSRSDAVAVTVDGGRAELTRSGAGTFQQSVQMDGPHSLAVVSVVQYLLSVSGGSGVVESPQSPTGDGFYDSGTSVTVSSARTWQASALTRLALVSYSLDGLSKDTPALAGDGSGDFAPTITLDREHRLAFGSTTQYLVAFHFTDALGSRTILPDSFQIGTSQPNATLDVQGSKAWLDSGSTFVIKQLLWERMDVRPLSGAVSVGAPQNLTLAARVYDGTVSVSDYLGMPISGVTAHIRLANGTTLSSVTGRDGKISLGSIPLGRFNATVSYLGASQSAGGDVSTHGGADVRMPVSVPDFAAAAGVAGAAILLGFILKRRGK